jgi:hypothetical protein
MKINSKNDKLDEMLFDCRLTLFGKADLDLFLNADNIKNYIEKDSLLYSSDFKILSRDRIAFDIGFYTVSNKYELKGKLNSLASKYFLGITYKLHVIPD